MMKYPLTLQNFLFRSKELFGKKEMAQFSVTTTVSSTTDSASLQMPLKSWGSRGEIG